MKDFCEKTHPHPKGIEEVEMNQSGSGSVDLSELERIQERLQGEHAMRDEESRK